MPFLHVTLLLMDMYMYICRCLTRPFECFHWTCPTFIFQFDHVPQETLTALVPLISFAYSSEVRSTASQAAAAVYNCSCQQGDTDTAQHFLPILVTAMVQQLPKEDESDPEARFAIADSASDVLYYTYRQVPTNPTIVSKYNGTTVESTTQVLVSLMDSCLKRRAVIIQKMNGPTVNQDDLVGYEQSLKSEHELLTPLVDSVGYTLKFQKNAYVPVFDRLVAPVLGPFLVNPSDPRGLFAALCLFDDVVEHCGPDAASKYAGQLLQGILVGIEVGSRIDESDIVQVALYGIAQIARYGPVSALTSPSVTNGGTGLIDLVLPFATASKNESDNLFVIENAVSALASMTLIGNSPLKTVAPTNGLDIFLAQLPLREDEDEAKICHAGLCELIESNKIDITKHFQVLMRIFGDLLSCVADGEDLLTDDTQVRLGNILSALQQRVPPNTMEKAFQVLSPDAQGSIHEFLQAYSHSGVHVATH